MCIVCMQHALWIRDSHSGRVHASRVGDTQLKTQVSMRTLQEEIAYISPKYSLLLFRLDVREQCPLRALLNCCIAV